MRNKYYFATYFDKNYLGRALALLNSLFRCNIDFHLYVLCMDNDSAATLRSLDLGAVTVFQISSLESYDPLLLPTKTMRSRIEYYYTCGPSFLRYVLDHAPEIDMLTYLDSDLYFFTNPDAIFQELCDSSVAITAHRFPPRQKHFERFGRFNVGWITFRRNADGMKCLNWWADRCLDWCYDRVEGNRFADQKYLDEFEERFRSVHVIQHKGANVAPWNIDTYPLAERDGCVWVADQPLVFFHFHGFKMVNDWLFDTNCGSYGAHPSRIVRTKIFGQYIRELRSIQESADSFRGAREESRATSRRYGGFVRSFRSIAQVAVGAMHRAYIVDLNREYS